VGRRYEVVEEAVRRIVVDWDATLAEESWPEIGNWLPGAVDALRALAAEFDEVVIVSCRLAKWEQDEKTPRNNEDQLELIENMLLEAGVPSNVYCWNRDYKPPAVSYIDDKAIRFNGYWGTTISKLESVIGKTLDYPGARHVG
jgi:hypothetical protein